MNHSETQRIIDELSDLVDPRFITLSTDNQDWLGRPSHSDYLTIEQEHGIGVEVFAGETRVDFFDDHTHFGMPYTFDDDIDPIVQTVEFLRQLLSMHLVKHEVYRGKLRTHYEWFFVRPDGTRESVAGPWLPPLLSLYNPFRKKRHEQSHWRYDRNTGRYVQFSDQTVSIHAIDWDIYIHIERTGKGFSYFVEQLNLPEDDAPYWAPLSLPGISIFDTEENALSAAKEAVKEHTQHR